MKKNILTVTLNPTIDKTALASIFHIGQDNRASSVNETCGGKGVNVSRTLTSLNVPTHVIGFVGGVTGNYIQQLLTEENIKYHFVQIKHNSRVNLTVIDQSTNKFTRVIETGPKVNGADIKALFKLYEQLLKKTKCVVCAGSVVGGMPTDVYAKMIRLARQVNVDLVIDAYGDVLRRSLEAKPFLIKPNREEAQELLGMTIRSKASIKKALYQLHQLGAKYVALTLDQQGAVLSGDNHIFYAQSPQLELNHYVGCGDAFIGGFLKGYYNELSLPEALRCGIAAGSANALTMKAGHIDLKSYRQFLKQINIEEW